MTVRKIKIIDDDRIRNKIDQLYEKQEQTNLLEEYPTFYGKDEFAIFDNNRNILTISC